MIKYLKELITSSLLSISFTGCAQSNTNCILPVVEDKDYVVDFDKRYAFSVKFFLVNKCNDSVTIPAPTMGYETEGAAIFFDYYRLLNEKKIKVECKIDDYQEMPLDDITFKPNERYYYQLYRPLSLCDIDERGTYFLQAFYKVKGVIYKSNEIKFEIK